MTTKQQTDAINRVYARICHDAEINGETPISWEDFQKEIQPTFGMDGAVVVPFAGMFLAIETDGYTHS
jgi:hypothetical protein